MGGIQNKVGFQMGNPKILQKMDDLGVPLFQEPPIYGGFLTCGTPKSSKIGPCWYRNLWRWGSISSGNHMLG